jgi:hypothetical protein
VIADEHRWLVGDVLETANFGAKINVEDGAQDVVRAAYDRPVDLVCQPPSQAWCQQLTQRLEKTLARATALLVSSTMNM